jgi:ketosteroid isomerase-like protein
MRAIAFFLPLLVAACASGPPTHSTAVRETIDQHNANLARWYASGDIDAVVSVFAKDAWQLPPNSAPLVGRKAIRDFWRQASLWGKWEFALEAQDVHVNGSLAVERGKYALTFTAGPTAPAGMLSFTDRGNYLVHWRHEADGQWRIVGDAPVSELPVQPGSSK